MSFGKTDLGKNFSPEERFCECRSDFLAHNKVISAKTSTILHVGKGKKEKHISISCDTYYSSRE